MILLHRLTAENFKQFEKIDLTFPDSGTILIEGNNESGKSSLFEAVFFALYGDGLGGVSRSELVRYGAEEARVTLEFSVEGRRFSVTRRQRDNQKVVVEIPQEGGKPERVNTLAAANRAIVEHIGLTAQSLLNTCFVEQKQLGHLESLKPEKREEAINELVNLKALTVLEEGLPRRSDDERRVKECQGRLRVAELDGVYGALEARWKELIRVAAASELRDIAARRERAEGERERVAAERTRITDLIALHESRERAEDLRRGPLALWRTAETAAEEARHALRRCDAARESLPDLTRRVQEAETSLTRLELRDKIEAEEARFARWQTENAAAKAAADAAEREQAAAGVALETARWAVVLAGERDALLRWAEARQVWDALQQTGSDAEEARRENVLRDACAAHDRQAAAAERAEAEAQQGRDSAAAFTREAEAQIAVRKAEARAAHASPPSETPPAPARSPVPGYGLAAVGVALVALGPVAKTLLLVGLGIALLAAGAVLIASVLRSKREAEAKEQERARRETERMRVSQEARERADAEESRLRQRIADETARADALTRAARQTTDAANESRRTMERAERDLSEYRLRNDSQERRDNAEHRLREAATALTEAGLRLPESASDAARLARERDGELSQPDATVAGLRADAAAAERQHGAVVAAHQEALKRVTAYHPAFTPTDDDRASVAALDAALDALGLTGDGEGLKRETDERRHALRDAEAEAGRRPEREKAQSAAEEAARSRRQEFADRWNACTGEPLSADADPEAAVGGVTAFTEGIAARIRVADPALGALDPSQLKARRSEADAQLGRLTGTLADLTDAETEPRQALSLPPAAQCPLVEILPPLLADCPDAATRTPDHWRAERDRAKAECADNRSRRKAHADSAGIGPESLDRDAEAEALEAAQFARDKNRAARDILSRTRSAIVERVMPGTQLCVGRILPRLTDDRYRDIRWIAEDNRIEVYDSRKGGYVAKRVFSGGARDQISLALRLAFALSALPGGSAPRPGWLFLDEPLSAFDERRSQSLIALLTNKGAFLRKQFPQIILVSHSKAFNPDAFDHRIEMHDGKIASTTLP